MQKLFTEPKIGRDGKLRFVWFRYYDVVKDKWVKLKKTGGANYSSLSKQDQAEELKGLCRAWKYKLEVEYYNPITKKSEPPKYVGAPNALTFAKAIEFALDKKRPSWSKKTCQDYASTTKYMLEVAYAQNLATMLIRDFKRVHYKTILEAAVTKRQLDAKGFNKYRTHLSSLVAELAEWELVDMNPIRDIKMQAEIKTVAHKPPTPEERKNIMAKIKKYHYNFYRFCSMIYATTIREKEILGLQIKDINLKTQVITIVPERSRENSKVRTERESIIPNSLFKILNEMNLEGFPPDFYVFSTGYLPGRNRLHSNTPTLQWKKIVKDAPKKDGTGGLGINKNLYGLKKLGGNDMVDLQKELLDLVKMPQKQMGHTTSKQTEVYVTRHKELGSDSLKKNMKPL